MTTVTRSWTISQPTAIRPCGVSSSPRSVERPEQDDGARDRHGQPEDEPPADPPAERDPEADPEQRSRRRSGRPRPGSRSERTASRSRIENWIPTPNISRITPSSASSRGDPASAMMPGRERAEEHPGGDVADDRGQPEAPGDQAADEGGSQSPTAMVEMRTGSWSMALPVRRGGAQDWRGSVPERRLVGVPRIPDADRCGQASRPASGDDESRGMAALARTPSTRRRTSDGAGSAYVPFPWTERW